MSLIYLSDLRLNAEITGPEGAPALVFIHPLGLDLRIWDEVVRGLRGYRILRFDLRGHGQSDTPPAPYSMGALIRDTERLIEHFDLKDAVVIGVALGGLIAQGLAVKRLDLVRALVLSNTAARIGFAGQWQERMAMVREGGIEKIADQALERWFGRQWRENPMMPRIRSRLLEAKPEGWIGCAAALAGTDFYETTATLRLPALFLAALNDASTPPDLVRETADLIPGSQFQLIRAAGHLPMVEKPGEYAELLGQYFTSIGHQP